MFSTVLIMRHDMREMICEHIPSASEREGSGIMSIEIPRTQADVNM